MKEFNLLKKFNWELASKPIEVKPYKVYTALISQYDGDAPVATVLENTLGEIIWTYDAIAQYHCNSNSLFTVGKTVNTLDQTVSISGPSDIVYSTYFKQLDVNTLQLRNFDSALNGVDNLLEDKLIEIRVYN
jgi:hypothetical protein